ncbi:MAG: ABC transporter ATP-binding protein [bacterium]|nr:ABC transporter ATP-binding protein [bacterium]
MNVKIKDILKVYWQQARRRKGLLVLMLLAVSLATSLMMAVPIYYRNFFNLLADAGPIPRDELAAQLIQTLLMIVGLNAAAWVAWRAATFANDYFQPRVMADLVQQAFDYTQKHSFGFFANHFVGALVRRVARLGSAFEMFFDRVYWNLFPLAIRVIGAVAVLYFYNKMIAEIILAWAMIFIIFNYLLSRWKLKYDAQRAQKDTDTTATIADAFTNSNNIQLFNGYRFEFGRLKKITEELRRLRTFTWNLDSTVEAAQGALAIAVEFLLMYLAIRLWQQKIITIGDFVLIQSYLIILINHLWDVGRQIRAIYESFSDAKEMVEILNAGHEIKDAPSARPLAVDKGKIEFIGVNFSFNKTRRVLSDINLTIKPEEKIALVGPSGAGKSTFVKLLFRFYELDSGKILIDGQKINRVTQESLRQALSMVPQETVLFHRTLMENIRYGRRDATDAEVIKAVKLAHCDEFIEDLPQKYETYVGERGIKLSGGERQRVAIARAILKNAPILVLDEATSSLDSRSELLIQDALARLMKNKTVIVIAHRLSTIRQMDRIIVLEKGKIIDQGTHEALLAKDGLYQDLWQLQAGGFLVA